LTINKKALLWQYQKTILLDIGLSYKPRIADKLLQEQLEAVGVVLIDGSKWCEKTTTAEHMPINVQTAYWLSPSDA
jgi:hypothetical protein